MINNQAFQQKLQPHVNYLYSFARYITGDRTEAEDLVQKTLIRAMDRFNQYEEGTNLRAWLSRIMKNIWIDEYRSRDRRSEREYKYARERMGERLASQTSCCPQERHEDHEHLLNHCLSDRLRTALLSISEKYRRVFILYAIRDLSYEEIADKMDCPLGTVRSRIHRAKKRLKSKINDPKTEMEPFRRKGFPNS